MAALTEPSNADVQPSGLDVGIQKEVSNGLSSSNEENIQSDKAVEEQQQQIPEIKKFVEAPIPKFNPWLVNRGQGGPAKGPARSAAAGKKCILNHRNFMWVATPVCMTAVLTSPAIHVVVSI